MLAGNLKGKDHSEILGIDGKTILKCILREKSVKVWTGFIWHRISFNGRFF
jgi:hypothetical protein